MTAARPNRASSSGIRPMAESATSPGAAWTFDWASSMPHRPQPTAASNSRRTPIASSGRWPVPDLRRILIIVLVSALTNPAN